MALDLSRFSKVFFEEAQEHVHALESLLIGVDLRMPDGESLNAIFRAVHSIKGGAAAFGHTVLADFTHALESILDRVRKHDLTLTKPMVDQFLRAGDLMRQHLRALETETVPDRDAMLAMQANLLASIRVQPQEMIEAEVLVAASLPAHFLIAITLARADYPDEAAVAGLSADVRGLGEIDLIATEVISAETFEFRFRLFAADIDAAELRESLEFLVPASAIHLQWVAASPAAAVTVKRVLTDDPDRAYEFFEPLEADVQPPPVLPAPVAEVVGTLQDTDIVLSNIADASSIRVSVVKVDQIINLVGELVIAEAMLSQSALSLPPEMLQSLSTGLAQLQRNTRDLQTSVMAIRMMPISFVFSRLPRLTRDLADRLGKEVELELIGEDTELDKSVIEKISDPLTHLVRNAIDHGVETPDERLRKGKPRSGRLTVSAEHKGGSVVICVSDDGAGLNRERILGRAHQSGLVGAEDWADRELWQLVFAPGFSTASAVTDVSGRGVGMDVVWKNVHALGGKTDIVSLAGQGTTITVRLPLTVAILEGMSINVSGETYILPLAQVMQSLQPAADDLQSVNGRQVVMVRGEYVPILSLHEVFDLPAAAPTERPILVVLEVDGLRAALQVDDLVGQQQVVLKSLESNYRKIAGVSAATILADGRVALIIDAAYLVGLSHSVRRERRQQHLAEGAVRAH